MADDRRIVSRLQSWGMRDNLLSDYAAHEPKYPSTSRAISKSNICEGI
jgi:hypothetical protein